MKELIGNLIDDFNSSVDGGNPKISSNILEEILEEMKVLGHSEGDALNFVQKIKKMASEKRNKFEYIDDIDEILKYSNNNEDIFLKKAFVHKFLTEDQFQNLEKGKFVLLDKQGLRESISLEELSSLPQEVGRSDCEAGIFFFKGKRDFIGKEYIGIKVEKSENSLDDSVAASISSKGADFQNWDVKFIAHTHPLSRNNVDKHELDKDIIKKDSHPELVRRNSGTTIMFDDKGVFNKASGHGKGGFNDVLDDEFCRQDLKENDSSIGHLFTELKTKEIKVEDFHKLKLIERDVIKVSHRSIKSQSIKSHADDSSINHRSPEPFFIVYAGKEANTTNDLLKSKGPSL